MSPKFPRSFPTPVDYGYHPSWMDRSYVKQRKNPTFRYLQGKYAMQQSELARPWLNEGPYLEMEYDPLVPGWPRPGLFLPDGPWLGGQPDLAAGYSVIFAAWAIDCYNDGETTEIKIKSTYPITGIAPGPTDSGYTISTVDAAEQIYSVAVDAGKTGFLYLICTLTVPYDNDQGLPGGLTGRATADVRACFGIDCSACTITWDDATSDDTVARSASAAIAVTADTECGPFDWSVSGTGFSLDNAQTTGLSNTLNADGTACGTASITVTDACGNEATGRVKCTTGVWTNCGSTTATGSCGVTCSSSYQWYYGVFNGVRCRLFCSGAGNDGSCDAVHTCNGTEVSARDIIVEVGDPFGGACGYCGPAQGTLAYFRYWECS